MKAWIALGGNIGDARARLAGGVEGLRSLGTVQAASSLYRSPPWGPVVQDPFLNAVVRLETDLNAFSLLSALKAVERDEMRITSVRWGPRTLDLDIIAIGGRLVETERLQVPHPRAHERAFVMVPTAEIDPELRFGSASAMEWAGRTDRAELRLIEAPSWAD